MYLCARTREKGVASLRKMPLFHAPAPESPTATSPGRRRKPKRKEKPVRVQRYYFLRRKRAADDMSRRVTSIKNAARTPYYKKRTCTTAKYEKTSKILCQNCVASLFLLIFLTFCVVRDHEAMGSNPVTPTIKNTHALFALCVFYLPKIRDLNGTLRKQHSALFLVPGVSTALAAQKKAHKTPAPVGLRSKSRHSDQKKDQLARVGLFSTMCSVARNVMCPAARCVPSAR